MSALRLIRDAGFGGRGNVALTAAMVDLHDAGKSRDTLRIYRYPACVLLGRNQRAAAAADLPLCRNRNIEVARRISGGGAIYLDAGVVTFDLLVTAGDGKNMATLPTLVCSAIARELAAFGISARFRPDNDVVSGGRKLFGASGFAHGTTLLYQGSLMVSPDVAAMADVLGIPDLADRVTTLSALARSPVTIRQAEDLLGEAVGRALGRALESDALSAEEIALQRELLDSEALPESALFPEQAAA